MDIKIIVATHKKYQMPQDDMYIPLHVGAKGKATIGYQQDSEGENISHKNAAFCELTGLYWAWKNLNSEFIGLVHYRRYFKGKSKSQNIFENVLKKKEAEKLLSETDIIVTKKRKYYIENIYNHYAHTLYVEPLDKTREIIQQFYPDYLLSFDNCMKHTYMHAFNMFIMRKDKLDEYCQWLFDILFRLEEELKDKKYNAFHARYPGRVSELLLDVWLEQKGYDYKEVPFIYMEPINKVKKVTSFLKAKFFKKKYGESF
ncbi:DUF4422 domain-containing protein [Massilimicrobiota timonensis]|uniref:DUF4422 domain-containing protein n=1 Tax=Massilimicrobiota timonensis TaxID=1776392 RepID=UPI00101B92B4|nr:DUF4422 domain-containing protein [Massilimicrobiota timonensis]